MAEVKKRRNRRPEEGEELLKRSEQKSPDLVKRYIKKLRLAKGTQLKVDSLDALKFFQRAIPKTTRIGQGAVRELIVNNTYKRVGAGNIFTGRMYLYQYDALWKDQLNYWDSLPLVFFFGQFRSKAGKQILQGLNLHYLPPAYRAKLLLELLKLKTGKSKSPKARLRLSWEAVRAVSKSKACMAAVHNYRVDHIKSKLTQIDYMHWQIVAFLQVAQWQKSSRGNVYKDSLARIKGK